MAVTDHDTVAALAEAGAACVASGLALIPGIEITAIENGGDLHVLGYFIDQASVPLASFLETQRRSRIERVKETAHRLVSLGMPIDVAPLLADASRDDGRSIGRPQIARALIAAGYALDTNDAFERWLGRGRPAFVPRSGATAEEVIATIHEARGLASLAHPGLARVDARIMELCDAGLDALEAYHPDHDPEARERYLQMARAHGLLVTGGSDYHGDPAHGLSPGAVTLPAAEWERLSAWRPRS